MTDVIGTGTDGGDLRILQRSGHERDESFAKKNDSLGR